MRGPVFVTLWLLLAFLAAPASAQWFCQWSTYDADTNGTGHRTPGVAVINEHVQIALVMRQSDRCYMLPYVDADSATGRLYTYGYGTDATNMIFDIWSDGAFDQVTMVDTWQIVATPDSFIYAASNDAGHNVLVFKFTGDTIITVPIPTDPGIFPRQETGSNGIFGIAVDGNGYVYVCNDTTVGQTADIKVYPPIGQWTAFHSDPPATTIDLPDGVYKGLAVSPDGSRLYVSDYQNRRVLRFNGSPAGGYVPDPGFSFALGDNDVVPTAVPGRAGPLGLAHLSPNNILAVACDSLRKPANVGGYSFGRIYLLNAETGEPIGVDSSTFLIDQAQWAIDVMGSVNGRDDGTAFGTASGYCYTVSVAFDEQKNLYSQSLYGWTIEKWTYQGTLPTFEATAVEGETGMPEEFTLFQNYPNPFNPTTVLSYSLPGPGDVRLTVFDLLGREVAVLVNGPQGAGLHTVEFAGAGHSSGVYIYELRSGALVERRTMTLLK